MNRKEINCTYLLFAACADAFSCSDAELGHTGRLKHAIDTGNHPPTHHPTCRVPPFWRKEVQKLRIIMLLRSLIKILLASYSSKCYWAKWLFHGIISIQLPVRQTYECIPEWYQYKLLYQYVYTCIPPTPNGET